MTENKKIDIFIENIIKKYNLDKNNPNELNEIILTSIVVNYYANMQFILFKRYLEKKKNIEINNEDLYELIKLIIPKLKDNYSFFDINILTVDDRRMIYNDISILVKMFDNNLINDSMIPGISLAIEKLRNHDLSIISNRRDCIENIKCKLELLNIGIENYIEKNLKILLKS